MKIEGKVMEAVVAEASARMGEARYTDELVTSFIQSQPSVSRYLTAKQAALGGAEGVMGVCFHAALLAEAVRRARGRPPPTLSFDDLDEAAAGEQTRSVRLTARQPSLEAYIESNVGAGAAAETLRLLGLAFDRSLVQLR